MLNEKTIPKPVNIKGITPSLSVFNLQASIRFYKDLLGFKITASSDEAENVDQWVLLAQNGITLRLAPRGEKCCPKPITANAWLDRHDMSLSFICTEIDELYAYLQQNGADVQAPAATSFGTKAIEIRDPDGFLISFHAPEA